MNYGYPATKSTGYSLVVPTYGKAVAPAYGAAGFAKPFGVGKVAKPFGVGKIGKVGKPFGVGKIGGFGKPFGKGFGAFGYPATKAAGYASTVPVTSVATSPYPGAI